MKDVQNRRILVLDDEPGILDAYKMILEPEQSLGAGPVAPIRSSRNLAIANRTQAQPQEVAIPVAFEVQYAKTGEEALALIEQYQKNDTPFAGGFFDVKLGAGMDGIETIRRAREINPGMLFVMVTAYQDRTVDEIAKIFGSEFADQWDFLAKPFSTNEILQKSRNLISNWERREKNRIYLAEIELQQKQLIFSERLAAIGTLSRNIGHEFGNILNRILGMAELALMKKEPPHMEETLKTVVNACERASHILSNLQGMVKIQATREMIDIHVPIHEALQLVDHELKKFSVRLTTEFDSSLPKISGHKIELGQVFLNLFINALHAMEDKQEGRELKIKTVQGPNFLEVSVTDNGMGIPEENLQKVFEPLFTTKAEKGTGIGLSVCQKIATNHNGRLVVNSTVGQGTTFTLHLPFN